jgi:hypothetical protein
MLPCYQAFTTGCCDPHHIWGKSCSCYICATLEVVMLIMLLVCMFTLYVALTLAERAQ